MIDEQCTAECNGSGSNEAVLPMFLLVKKRKVGNVVKKEVRRSGYQCEKPTSGPV